ncbi:MAG: hypothetical protein H7Z14_10505 [Anaerolineae bacterium]|nr:hypothetical protein [Phycisphaerae bacterium]
MRPDTTNSAVGTGTTSPPPTYRAGQQTSPRVEPRFAPQRKTYESSTDDKHNGAHKSDHDAKPDETKFLQTEAERAKAAMSAAFTQATKDLAHGVDPRAWAASHPWIALATAAVSGFVAATQIVPSRDEQMMKKLEKIQDALTGQSKREREREKDRVQESIDPGAKTEKTKNRSFLSIIGTEAIRYLGPALSSAFSAAMAGKSVAESAQKADAAADGVPNDPNAASDYSPSDPASAI